MNTKQKCCCKVFDQLSRKKGRVCRANVWTEFGGKKYCYSHAKKKLAESCIIIQKHYRGTRNREIINNIYIKLPLDIQRIIDKYINEEIYYKKECNVIQKIIYKRFINIETELYKLCGSVRRLVDEDISDIDLTALIYYYAKEINSIVSILIKNWNNIIIIYNSQSLSPFLVKLFNLAKHGIWGTTVWNGKSVDFITNYISYIMNYSIETNLKNLNFASEYFDNLSVYSNLFVNTFRCERTSMQNYRLIFL